MTNSEIRNSVRTLERSQFSAKGSDLTLAVCGWQPVESMEFTSVSSDLFPDSSRSRGRGYLQIEARGKGFTCNSKIFFTYTEGYTGGHGSYENYTNFAAFDRETPVPSDVSKSPASVPIGMGEERSSSITRSSRELPDGSLADFYSIEIRNKTGLRVRVQRDDAPGNQSFYPRAYLYQNQKYLCKDDSNQIVKPGTLHIVVTSGLASGRYRIKVIELTDEEKSGLIGWP